MTEETDPMTGTEAPTTDAATGEPAQASKQSCWEGRSCSGRLSVRRLFWRRSWNCSRETQTPNA